MGANFVYLLRVALADLMDWIDDRLVGHRFHWLCCLIVQRLYPGDWCSAHGRFSGDRCPQCQRR